MITLNHVSFSYGNAQKQKNLYDITLEIKTGETVLFCGESGCGKSTLTRLLNGLIPQFYQGELEGHVRLDGQRIADQPLYRTAKLVGSVFQNPRSQFYTVNTTSELAFCSENLGYPKEEILSAIDTVSRQMDLHPLLNRSIFELSGGEKQKIACGSVSVSDPSVVVLDEPTSNLDAAAIEDLKNLILLWKRQGKTIILAEHRLYFLLDLVDRIFYMKDGRIEREFSASQFRSLPGRELAQMGLRAFSPKQFMVSYKEKEPTGSWITVKDLQFGYHTKQPALSIPELLLPQRESIAVIGPNGAGKSTLARCLCGLVKQCKGRILLDGTYHPVRKLGKHSYMVMQDVNHQLFTERVYDEVLLSTPGHQASLADKVLKEMDLILLADRHPMSLSGGQKQRVAVASAVVSDRNLLLFDEPTSGLDRFHMLQVSQMIKELESLGKTILTITHDLEFILQCCSWVLHMEKGQVQDLYPLNRAGIKKVFSFFGQSEPGGVHEIPNYITEQTAVSRYNSESAYQGGRQTDYAGAERIR